MLAMECTLVYYSGFDFQVSFRVVYIIKICEHRGGQKQAQLEYKKFYELFYIIVS
jgi:hypothetical protein